MNVETLFEIKLDMEKHFIIYYLSNSINFIIFVIFCYLKDEYLHVGIIFFKSNFNLTINIQEVNENKYY